MQKTITPKKNGSFKRGPSEQTVKRLIDYSRQIKTVRMPDKTYEIINSN